MDLGSQAAGIGALADDTRRVLYEYVVAQPEPVGREQAATALGIAQHNVNFHLDRLVSEGLLEVEFRRLSGRSGPGAGRPSKLYRRARQEFAVSLPPRRYDLVGDILAAAVGCAEAGKPLRQSLQVAAREEGRTVGRAALGLDAGRPLNAVAEVLGSQGYQPHVTGKVVELSNCPFDALAQKHTALVCGLNRDFVQGVAEGLGCPHVEARLEPEPGKCCVKAHAEDQDVRPGHPSQSSTSEPAWPDRSPGQSDPSQRVSRWEDAGGVWRVLARSGEQITVALLSCDGEEMARLTSTDAGLAEFIGHRDSSED